MKSGTQDFLVIKLGGSLLDLPDLADRIRTIVELSCEPGRTPLIVTGGGPAANVIREWDRVHSLDEPSAHWMAVRSLRLPAELLTQLLPESAIVASASDAESKWNQKRIPVLDCLRFLDANSTLVSSSDIDASDHDSTAYELPKCWDVTSDSIALFAALRIESDRLLLLKSIDCPIALSPREAAQQHQIDAHFPELLDVATNPLSIRWCNLRNDDLMIDEWL